MLAAERLHRPWFSQHQAVFALIRAPSKDLHMGSTDHVDTEGIINIPIRCIAAAVCNVLKGKQCRSIAVGNRIVLCRISPCCGAHEGRMQAWRPGKSTQLVQSAQKLTGGSSSAWLSAQHAASLSLSRC